MTDIDGMHLIGQSGTFLESLSLTRRFAACDATVLVQGETGTGKELIARAIHYFGPRRGGPFIPVNCGALPDTLVENELFGHAAGAFTDARERHAGLVNAADGGTLFLDEIESLPAKAQVALLRFLQDGTYRPLGARGSVISNVRVVAASNVDLAKQARAGTFRPDLLYRLAILSVWLPPLRERLEDVLPLARHFLERIAQRYGRVAPRLDRESVTWLENHPWPGNVRELENLIHREFLLCESDTLRIRPACAPAKPAPQSPKRHQFPIELGFRRAKALAVETFEREFIQNALARSRGSVSAAARLIGKERRSVGRLVRKYHIDRNAFV